MKLSEFIRRLKEAIHKEGYNAGELTLDNVRNHNCDCYEVCLVNSRTGEEVYIVIEDEIDND